MNKKIKIIPAVLGIGLGLGLSVISAEGAVRPSGAYAWMKRLFLKGAEGAVDQAARQAIQSGAPHEEYELTTMGVYYWDTFAGTFRGEVWPTTYRSMWLDPVTLNQNFETYTNRSLQHRFPFYYELHNRDYRCKSFGDPLNGYHFMVQAKAYYLLKDRVVKAQSGQEIFFHPVNWEFGLTMTPASCYNPPPPFDLTQEGSTEVARGGGERVTPFLVNADIRYLIAGYGRQ